MCCVLLIYFQMVSCFITLDRLPRALPRETKESFLKETILKNLLRTRKMLMLMRANRYCFAQVFFIVTRRDTLMVSVAFCIVDVHVRNE